MRVAPGFAWTRGLHPDDSSDHLHEQHLTGE